MRIRRLLNRGALIRFAAICAVLGASLTVVGVVLADIVIPPVGVPAFIQTSGPNTPLNIGDYRTSVLGDNQPHDVTITIPCVPDTVYEVDIFDPALDPGVAIDEIRNAANATTNNIVDADTATFVLSRPDGAVVPVGQTVFPPGTSNDAWFNFGTINVGAAPVQGVNCGPYKLTASTSNNDDNAWAYRLVGIDDGAANPFQAENGPDNLPGTGDEPFSGIQHLSYQHSATGCQNFYWFVPNNPVNPQMYMLNFDMDDPGLDPAAQVCYFPPGTPAASSCAGGYPGAPVVQGTVSNATVWNDTAPQQQARPGFAAMNTFDPAAADNVGDAITNPAPGIWRGQVCTIPDNQYSFEVPGFDLYLAPPPLPDLQLAKTDNVGGVAAAGGTVTYTLTVRNVGLGGAVPVAGPELVDALPAGITASACAINLPLVGACTISANKRTINFNFTGQTILPAGVVPAYLSGSPQAPNNAGSVTVTTDVDVAACGTLTNVANVAWTDSLRQVYKPGTSNDPVQIPNCVPPPPTATPTQPSNTPPPHKTPPAFSTSVVTPTPDDPGHTTVITKTGSPSSVIVGEHVKWTITVTNPTQPSAPKTVTDNVPSTFTILSTSTTAGTVTTNANQVTVQVPSLGPGSSVVVTIITTANDTAQPGTACNLASVGSVTTQGCVNILPNNLPPTGGRPVTPSWPFVIAGIVAGIGLGALLWGFYAGKKQEA